MTSRACHPPVPAELGALSDAELTEQICTWAGRLAAGEARLLLLIGELERRQAWFAPGFLTCAHWLSWRLGFGIVAARERVRVARALTDLPLITAAMSAGRMSYAQVRAASRVATPEDEHTWVELAGQASGAQLERLARGVARVHRTEADQTADPEDVAHRMRTRVRYLDDGTMTINLRLSAQDGAVVLAGLERAREDLERQHQQAEQSEQSAATDAPASAEASTPPTLTTPGTPPTPADASAEAPDSPVAPTGPRPPDQHRPDPYRPFWLDTEHAAAARAERDAAFARTAAANAARAAAATRPSLADGLVHLTRTGLEALGAAHPDAARRSRSRLTAQIDPLSGWARLPDGELLPPDSLDEVLRTPPDRLRRLTPADLTAHDQGRALRDPSLELRELLGALDGERCRFPGCTRHRKLHAHHVRFWEQGGPSDLANLVLVCSRHHTLIHRDGYQLDLRPDRTLVVRTADGTPLLHHPAPPWADPTELDPQRAITARTPQAGRSDQRLDLGYAVSVLVQQAA